MNDLRLIFLKSKYVFILKINLLYVCKHTGSLTCSFSFPIFVFTYAFFGGGLCN